jgi:hypothetical protein
MQLLQLNVGDRRRRICEGTTRKGVHGWLALQTNRAVAQSSCTIVTDCCEYTPASKIDSTPEKTPEKLSLTLTCEQALSGCGLWERNDVADGGRASEQHCQPVQAQS